MMNWNKKKYDFPAWVFCFIFSESKCQIFCGNFLSSYPTLLAIFSVLPPHPDFLSHLHLPALFAFFGVLPLCCIIVCLPTRKTLSISKHFILKVALHFGDDVGYSSTSLSDSCAISWQVPTFTTYFLVLFQYFRQTFPFVFLRGHCLLNWLDFFLFWCHLFW